MPQHQPKKKHQRTNGTSGPVRPAGPPAVVALTESEAAELRRLDTVAGERLKMIAELAIQRSQLDTKIGALVGVVEHERERWSAYVREVAAAHGITDAVPYNLDVKAEPLAFRRVERVG